ncbi:hypothetical protein DFJ63DRAFT_109234 [Scheffersomyces coipomensis]|uniref:uncharacterized protein n=1 Tax=Scheffersomyces coipomensis TaxID=1788519 RepID=UPI00315C9D3F
MNDRIEVISQPENDGDNSDHNPEGTLEKLKHLVEEHPKQDEVGDDYDRNRDKKDGSNNQDVHSQSSIKSDEPYHTKDGQQLQYDEDGFLIPPGKIPLDGNFSTAEIKELIQISQDNGLLSDGVDVQVVDHDSHFGDRVVIKDVDDSVEDVDDTNENEDSDEYDKNKDHRERHTK